MIFDGTLKTPRLALRCLDPERIEQRYVDWLNDATVNRYLEVRFARQDLVSVRDFVREANLSSSNLLFGMFDKSSDIHIGNIKIGPISSQHRRADVGLLIGERAYWGKGHASEAIAAVTAYACGTLGLLKLTAGMYGGNVGCYKAFLKAGYVEEARLKGHWSSSEGRDQEILVAYFHEQES